MNANLHDLIDHAEASLGPADRDKLATLLESFLAAHEGEEPFTEEERARLAAEPGAPAKSAEVAAFFARRG